jgi:AbrB family looped-hinge helix DNA binding protein
MAMAVVLAIYGFLDLVVLLATAQVDCVKTLLQALGIRRRWKHVRLREKATEGVYQLGESAMRFVTISDKGRVTIPVKLRERFGLKTGTSMDWSVKQGRLVLTSAAEIKRRNQRPGRGRKKN